MYNKFNSTVGSRFLLLTIGLLIVRRIMDMQIHATIVMVGYAHSSGKCGGVACNTTVRSHVRRVEYGVTCSCKLSA